MHRVVKSHLDRFVQDSGLANDDESKQFEKFCNHCLLQPKVASKLDLDDITTDQDDDGIDGLALVINEDLIRSAEDAALVFSKDRRNNDVEIAFVQAKRSERYDLGDFLKFKAAILRFLEETSYSAKSELQRELRAAFEVGLDNVPKIRDGKPTISAAYVSTGTYQEPDELEKAREELVEHIAALGYFSRIDVRILGRDDLIKAWVESYSGVESNLLMHSHAGLPQLHGIDESYLAVVRAKDFIAEVLTAEDGTIRSQIFEDNVRHFLGSENPVNRSMAETLGSDQSCSRFPVLNNGVTIVSPDVVVQSNRLFVKNYQIVNGCQTSHVLFENKDEIDDNVMVTLKVVETDDEDVFGELVRATNTQTEIKESQFLSLRPIARDIEAYFNTFEGQEGRLYFERRLKQYVGRGVPGLRIIDLDAAARSVCAMYLRRPDLAFRYPKQMYESHGDRIFDKDNEEAIYYSSALVLYRIHVLTSSSSITNYARKYKWHVLAVVGALVGGKEVPPLNSRAVEKYAERIIEQFQVQSEQVNETLTRAVDLITGVGEVTNDRLKRQAIMEEILGQIS